MSLVSSTLHPLEPLPLQLDHSAGLHLVVLEPGHFDHREHLVAVSMMNMMMMMMMMMMMILKAETCIQPPQCA